MGDPAGIGPEISLRAALTFKERLIAGELKLLLVGSSAAVSRSEELNYGALRGAIHLPGVRIIGVEEEPHSHAFGQLSAAAGEVAYRAAEACVGLVRSGAADGIVTAPLNKEALFLAGRRFAGYTDMLAYLTGSQQAVMMLAHGPVRISHVTTHVALSEVPKLVTPERLERVVRLTADALRAFGIKHPRIAVAALNPHAGEGGNFGIEDDLVIRPTIDALCTAGLDVDGPVPGDTVFVKHVGGQYDAVVAMYHDQGHIPFKLLGFKIDPASGKWDLHGTNISLGLPLVRTSVDHGTAFDIAGSGTANADSMVEAIEVALKLIRGRERVEDQSEAEKAKRESKLKGERQ
ncbi:4-hydroxythreonine-4-phosphate dehydrogenase [Silicimonas algicola]|uniref:4-hydroxythreonine-4-phosphate dehydrogenase n=2 Tax=Silicimonas algicola TaxID=1826607 RepID=A0A316GC84_9RHOB|nr:4-hydroxythreonine-4-phosphate dehydrogenase [Silicimonas algicola]